jgi:hypothetical protein
LLVKFFVYIADSKLDLLLASLAAEERQRLAEELDVDIRQLELPEVPRGASEEIRFARASAVALHLEQSGQCGGLASDRPFIAERGPVHWGRLRVVRGAELIRHETESPASFAFGCDGHELIMTGSATRFLAQPPSAKIDEAGRDGSTSHAWFSVASLAGEFDDGDRRCLEQTFDSALPPSAADGHDAQRLASVALSSADGAAWMQTLGWLRSDVRSLPTGRLEFLSKRLATFVGGQVDPTRTQFDPWPPLVLASPLYVAMTL